MGWHHASRERNTAAAKATVGGSGATSLGATGMDEEPARGGFRPMNVLRDMSRVLEIRAKQGYERITSVSMDSWSFYYFDGIGPVYVENQLELANHEQNPLAHDPNQDPTRPHPCSRNPKASGLFCPLDFQVKLYHLKCRKLDPRFMSRWCRTDYFRLPRNPLHVPQNLLA